MGENACVVDFGGVYSVRIIFNALLDTKIKNLSKPEQISGTEAMAFTRECPGIRD